MTISVRPEAARAAVFDQSRPRDDAPRTYLSASDTSGQPTRRGMHPRRPSGRDTRCAVGTRPHAAYDPSSSASRSHDAAHRARTDDPKDPRADATASAAGRKQASSAAPPRHSLRTTRASGGGQGAHACFRPAANHKADRLGATLARVRLGNDGGGRAARPPPSDDYLRALVGYSRAHWSSLLPCTTLPPPVGAGTFSLHCRFPLTWLRVTDCVPRLANS